MKRDTLRLSQHQFIETSRDINGRYFIAYSGGASVFIREAKELRRFLKIPKSIPMRESLESWLTSLEDMDAKRKAPAQEAPSEPGSGSWDPLALSTEAEPIDNAIDNDPTANTRMIT